MAYNSVVEHAIVTAIYNTVYGIEAGTSDVVLALSGQVAVPAAWVAAAAKLNR